MTQLRLHVLAIAVCCLMVISSVRADEQGPVFESEIQPVLARTCGKCHSDRIRKGGLDLSSINGRRFKGTQCAGIKPVWNRECKYLTKKVQPITSAFSGGADRVTGLS